MNASVLDAASHQRAAMFAEWIGYMLISDDELAREASKDDLFNELLRRVCRLFEDGALLEAEATINLVIERFNCIQNRAFTNRRARRKKSAGPTEG